MRHPFFVLLTVFVLGGIAAADVPAQAPKATTASIKFSNPISVGQDPSVVRDGGRYLWCQSDNEVISISVSDTLTELGQKHLIWESPITGPYSQEVWAPELMRIGDRWYIYFAASDGENRNHRTYVLSSKTLDPLGEYELHGPLYTGDDFESQDPSNNIWAIDMTVLSHRGRMYALWSGWTTPDSDVQCLYIAPMVSPISIAANRVMICRPDTYLWERVDETEATRGLNEGPTILENGGRTFVVYSASASWLPSYKLGMLELIGDNPLDPASWKKWPEPVFQSTADTFGVGHGCFTTSPDGKWWHIYHAKDERKEGWKRSIFVQPMHWTAQGIPDLGRPVSAGVPLQFP
ncbi:MAG: family 43 glycosylhydrolase [Planctomycetaceae bacterium]